ncbi:MAG: nitroreductase family protein [Clostridiales bacterium]|nr:nitroreductase family protein [Clostridiales bacterium]
MTSDFINLVKSSRSYRRFDESFHIDTGVIENAVEVSRFTPSTVNSQAIKYIIVNNKDDNEFMFGCLAFAGLLKGRGTPKEGERPSAYIIILCDNSIGVDKKIDEGIVAQTILLSLAEQGLGGCMLGSIDRAKIASHFEIDTSRYSIDLVLAIGKPDENVVLTDSENGESVAYYRDENGTHYVPKRKLSELIIRKFE